MIKIKESFLNYITLYAIKYSYQMQMQMQKKNCAQLYDFKYSCLIVIILK